MEPLHRAAQHDSGQCLVGHHIEVARGPTRPGHRDPDRGRSSTSWSGRVHPVGIHSGGNQLVEQGAVSAVGVQHPAGDARSARPPRPSTHQPCQDRATGPALSGRSGIRWAATAASRSSTWSTTTWNIRETAQANLTIWWTMKLDVPADGLADQTLDVAAHRLLGVDGHGHVDVGGPVHQGQGLAQPGLSRAARPGRTRGRARRARARGRRGRSPEARRRRTSASISAITWSR